MLIHIFFEFFDHIIYNFVFNLNIPLNKKLHLNINNIIKVTMLMIYKYIYKCLDKNEIKQIISIKIIF